MNGIIDLPVLIDIYWVINPYYEISRVVAKLSGAKKKHKNNVESMHIDFCHFYDIVMTQDYGLDFDVVLFWIKD